MVQIERRQNKFNLETEILFGMGRKHCGERGKCWLPAFSPFPTTFSKGFLPRFVKSQDLCGEGLIIQIIFGKGGKY